MRVRIDYTTEVDDRYRRAINLHYGLPGLATRDQVKRWLRDNGTQGDADLIWELQQAEEREREGT